MSNKLLGLLNNNELLKLKEHLINNPINNEMTLIKEFFKIVERPEPDFYNPLDLFHAHFILFNGLHRLNCLQDDFYIFIELTRIQLIKKDNMLEPTLNMIEKNDNSLEKYYLDEKHFTETSKEKINTMLEEFTIKFNNYLSDNTSIHNWQKITNRINSIEDKQNDTLANLKLKHKHLSKYLD